MPKMEQVKASAGSGKTYEITQRFLQFLAQSKADAHTWQCGLSSSSTVATAAAGTPAHFSWGDIMAITFTNLATQEMKDRILKSLKEIALQSKPRQDRLMSKEKAHAWVETILHGYSALNIRTIDSLLHLIVRTSALSMGFSPDFESSFHLEEISLPIFEALLEQAEAGDAHMQEILQSICHSILMHSAGGGFGLGNKIEEAVFPLVELLLAKDLPPLSSYQSIEEKLEGLRKDFFASGEKLHTLSLEEELHLSANAKKYLIKCTLADMSAVDSAFSSKESLDDLINKSGKGKASALAQRTYEQLKAAALKLSMLNDILQDALKFYPYLELAQRILSVIFILQKKDGKIPYSLMAGYVQEILDFKHGVSAALCRLGNNVHHVLLDEFQDTSREQWDALCPLMVEALSRGGSLTFVGDVKQAIYGWRGGDSALFEEVFRHEELIDKVTPSKKTLPTNWRSKENIVKTNNLLFAPLQNHTIAENILTELVGAACPQVILQSGVEKLTTAFQGVEQEVKENAAGGFVSIENVGDDTFTANELEEAVKERLHAKLKKGLNERYQWSDMAILVRKKAHASMVAEWLLQWEIPAMTENSLLLHTHSLIGESVALLQFLHCPEDDLAFWSILTGQMLSCILSDNNTEQDGTTEHCPSLEELHMWRISHNEKDLPLYKMFMQRWPLFWQHVFAPFYASANILTPYASIQEWYRLWHIPERFKNAETFLRRFLEIVHSAEEQGVATLGAFLELWDKEGKKEKTPTPNNINAVQILTIHKSKGLQFPVVIVPWMNFNIQDDKTFMVHTVEQLHVLVPQKKYVGEAYYAAQVKNALESLFVLYVACTRAEEELHLFHTHSQGKKGGNYLSAGLDVLFETLCMDLPYTLGNAKITEALPIAEQLSPSIVCPAVAKDFGENPPRLLDWQPRLKVYREPLKELLHTENTDAYGLSPVQRGLLMHHCLEMMQKNGLILNYLSDANQGQEQLRQHMNMLLRMGIQTFAMPKVLSAELFADLAQELTEKLLWCVSLPNMHTWFQYGLAEQSILNTPEEYAGKTKQNPVYRIDLLLPPLKAEQGYKLMDFKTGKVEQGHVLQLQKYIQLLNNIAKNTKTEGVLIYLDLQQCRMVQASAFSELLQAPQWQGE